MADPFEVRMRFTTLLAHLSASTTSQMKAAHYALKHRDMDEDLHSCILENLERGHNMNNRANVMYFLEHHADVNMKEGGHENYVVMVRRDISRIVEAVAQSGANVKVARRVVTGLSERGVLAAELVTGIEEGLREKEDTMDRLLGQEDTAEGEGDKQGEGQMQGVESTKAMPRKDKEGKLRREITDKDRKAIEQRIEEDRERNKRLREGVWAVSGDDELELEKMWDEGSDIGEDDYIIAQEEAGERARFARYHRAMLAS